MAPEAILSARFSCSHCGHAGIFWNADGANLPNVSKGFHLEDGRHGPNALPIVVCDHCDEIMDLRPEG